MNNFDEKITFLFNAYKAIRELLRIILQGYKSPW